MIFVFFIAVIFFAIFGLVISVATYSKDEPEIASIFLIITIVFQLCFWVIYTNLAISFGDGGRNSKEDNIYWFGIIYLLICALGSLGGMIGSDKTKSKIIVIALILDVIPSVVVLYFTYVYTSLIHATSSVF